MPEFVEVAKTEDLKPGEAKVVSVKGKKYALFNVDGKFYVTQNECSHKGGPLGDGDLDGKIVTCPWHGAKFDLTTGKVLHPPATNNIKTFEVKVVKDSILVKV